MQTNSVIRAVESELPHYPGVKMEAVNGGKHRRLQFTKDGESRFLTVPRTPSDFRAPRNAIRDFRKTMSELGVERVGETPGGFTGKVRRLKRGGDANFSMNDTTIMLHIPTQSRIIKYFKTADAKAAAHWTLELRASPDLSAPPLLVAKQVSLQPGKIRQHGIVGGFLANKSGSWRVPFSRSVLPALDKLPEIAPCKLKAVGIKADEIVFRLPPGTVPTTYQPQVAKAPADEFVDEIPATPAPLKPAPAPEPAEPVAAFRDQPITLQFPKQAVSVEQAIAVLNRAKDRLGNNLRFTITEGGRLTATHRIGY